MYDVTDENAERVFSSLLHLLRSLPDRLAKTVLAEALEETALLGELLREAGAELPEGEEREEALGHHWEAVQEGRDARAGALLKNLMRMEG